jgi:phosphoserine phosphatase
MMSVKEAKEVVRLDLWRDGTARRIVEEFVTRVTDVASAEFVEPAARIAIFDNDGTLWAEKPYPVELGFIFDRFAALARQQPELGERQPWKAALEGDTQWLDGLILNHYQGDGRELQALSGAIAETFAGMPLEQYEALARDFLYRARHPTLGRRFIDCAYAPMTALIRYLEANGFTTYIAPGGDRDFMGVFTQELYGIPSERVIGNTNALRVANEDECGPIAYLMTPDTFDDGPVKPMRIWSGIARRPILAVGNSNGDLGMLQFAGGARRPSLRLVLLHDDPQREFGYASGAERTLDTARARGWGIISMRNDWKRVFPTETPRA